MAPTYRTGGANGRRGSDYTQAGPELTDVARSRARSALQRRVRISSQTSNRNTTQTADVFSTASHQDPPLPEVNNNPYGRMHPMNHAGNHLKLLQHVIDRMLYGKSMLEQRAARFSIIDRDLIGFLKLDEEDKRRDRENKRGRGFRAVDVKMNLAFTQLDECLTYLMSVFAPCEGMFEAVARPDLQHIANAFANRMNQDGDKFKYYRNFAKGFLNMLKYNLGGWLTEWREIRGIVFEQDPLLPGQAPQRKTDTVWAGNAIQNLDVYNLLWDPTVHPCDVALKGEYFGTIDIYRKFDILRMAANGEIFDVWKFINTGMLNARFYQRKPDVRIETDGSGSVTGSGNQDWFKIMSGGVLGDVSKGYELINFYGWLYPYRFGLSPSKDLEVWRITVANSNCIVRTDPVDSSHGMLPIAMGSPVEDDLGLQQKSHGETLLPLQNFASSLLNTHQRANRKALYGVTIYNPNVVPLGEKRFEDMESAKIPAKPPGFGDFDIRKHLYQFTDAPKTEQTLDDIEKIMQLMQKILPTDMLKQVADLQRATMYQAAATVQGANRRNLKMARMIEDQAMKDVRMQCMYNIYDNLEEPLEAISPDTGQVTPIMPNEFKTAHVEFTMAEGLKGIDKMYIVETYKELMGMIVQSQQALQQFDFIKFFNFIGSLMGDKTDISQFKIQNPLTTLPPEMQQAIVGLMQDGKLQPLIQSYMNQLRGAGQQASNNVLPLQQGGGKGTPGQAFPAANVPGTGAGGY